MEKIKKKIDIDAIVILLILLLPFLDIYKSIIGNKIEIMGISLIEIFNFMYTFVLLLILIIKAKKENTKLIKSGTLIGIIAIFGIYMVGHTINILRFNSDLIATSNINYVIEAYHIVKSYVLPIILLFVFAKINIEPQKIVKALSFLGLVISLIIIVTNVLKVSLVAYSSYYENTTTIEGSIFNWGKNLANCNDVNLYTSRGLFYSANQMSAILAGLTFVSAMLALKSNKIGYYISLLLKCIALLMISTKTALFAIFLSIIYILAYGVFERIVLKENILKLKSIISCAIIIIVMSSLYMISPVRYKLKNYVNTNISDMSNSQITQDPLGEEGSNIINNDKTITIAQKLKNYSSSFGIPPEYIEFYPVDENIEFWSDIIDNNAAKTGNFRKLKSLIYENILQKNNQALDRIFGIGYTSNFPELERDVLSQNILFGYIGTIIFVIPFFILALVCLAKMGVHLKDNLNAENYGLLAGTLYILISSLYTGHIFGIFIPSAVLAIMLGTLTYSTRKVALENNENSKEKYCTKPELEKKN